MKITKLIVFLLLIVHLPLNAQPRRLTWRAPSIQDLRMKQYDEAPEASAIVLERYADVYFDDWREELRLIYDYRERIKILKPEGSRYAHLAVPYIGYDYFEDFEQVKGFVYRLKNNRIQRKRLKKKYIIFKQLDSYHNVMEINFPDLQPGDIVEIRYTLATFNFLQPRRFYFQENIPVRYAEFNANIPFFMKYYFDVYTFNAMDVKTVEPAYAQIEWTARYTDPIPSGMYYRGYDFRANPSFNFHSNYYHLVMKDVTPFYTEDYIDNPSNYYYHVDMKLKQLTRDIGYNNEFALFLWEKFSKRLYQTATIGYRPLTRLHAQNLPYPAGYFIFDATSWNRLAHNLRKDPAFSRELKRFANVLPVINRLKKEHKDSLGLAVAIYQWVRDSIKWNGHYDFLLSHHLSKTLDKRQGNSADINMLLIYMLRRAGLKADPVIIRTLDKGHLITDLAAFYQFNHLLAGAFIRNKLMLLDATSHKPWFILPQNDMNQIGFFIRKDTAYFVSINHPIKPEKSYKIQAEINNASQQLTGSITYYTKGLYTLDSTLFTPEVNDRLVSLVYESMQKSQAKIEKHYTFVADSIIKQNDSAYIVYPMRIFKNMKNIFSSYSRSYPIYLGYTRKWSYDITITLPDKVKDVAFAPIKSSLSGAKVTLTAQVRKHELKINLVLDISRYYFDTKEYQDLYNLFDTFEKLAYAKIIVPKR